MTGEHLAEAPSIRVAIVEDRREIRGGLQALIDGTPGYSCAGAWRSMEDALDGLPATRPDVALVDIGLPGMSGIEGIRLLRQRRPDLRILMLTVYDDDERIFAALCAGAAGYLLKKTPPVKLLESLKDAMEGGGPMSPEVAARVIGLFRRFRPPEKADHLLTPHESRLLAMFVEGHNYKTTAAELGVSVNTISYHVRHIYEKLQVHSRSEAVARALRDQLLR